ncbi:MAG TPA: PAS domain S-box protein [Thermoanaerobaculia bacterium]
MTRDLPSLPVPRREPPDPDRFPLEGADSAAFLAAIVDSSDDAIVGKTLDGVVRSWNPAAERLFGWTAAEAVGRSILLIIPPERHDEERVILERLRRGEGVDHFDTVRVTKDGRRVRVSLTVSPIFGRGGEIVGASKIARDVGSRREAEERLAASEGRFRALADNIAQLVWTADPGGAITWYNKRWFDFTGTTPDEMAGDGWRRVVHPDHLERVEAGFRAAIERDLVWEDTFPLRRFDGAWRWFLSRALPIEDETGAVTLWFGTNTDITERMEMEAALREADRRKDEFLATLAHELRNPLAPIASGLQLLRLRAGEPEVTEKVLRTMERQTSHLVRMVDDLLDVSRITRGKIELRRSQVDLANVVAGAVEAARPLLDHAGHRFSIDLPPEPLLVDADPVRLGQVLSNLLNNAARYTPEGGRVQLTVERQGDAAVITVRDSGVGFEPQEGERLFDLFVQGEGEHTARTGLGIGLTLVRSLVELHGGSVSATSEGPGRGSVFTVRLPLTAAPARPAAADAQPDPAASAWRGSGRPLRVLIADDNRDAADALRELLEVLGHRARAVYGGEEAIAAAAELDPQVVLLDLGMPGVDGYETARRLRERGEGRRTPVLVALTGWGQEEDRRRTREAGFDHHLVKPADLQDLRRLLDEAGERAAVR